MNNQSKYLHHRKQWIGHRSFRRLLQPGLLAVLMLLVIVQCRPREASNFDVASWSGIDLNGEQVRFADLNQPGLILNAYSPTCVPCIEEMPALHVLYEEARSHGMAMYLVVEGNPFALGIFDSVDGQEHLVTQPTFEENYQLIRQRLQQDIEAYGIEIPMVIMHDGYMVAAADSLLTGTPETMFFRTQPLVLEYNFIGPIALGRTVEELAQNSRMQFALSILDRLREARRPVYDENAPGPGVMLWQTEDHGS